MKVLITGASGLLGTALVDHLADDFEVVGVSRKPGFCPKHVSWVLADLLDLSETSKLLQRIQPQAVIHCAALVNVDLCEKDGYVADQLHRRTTEVIVKTLAKWNGRLIYISTDSVFNGRKDDPYTEKDLPDPPNAYARTKLGGELAALSYSESVVLRTNIFGWSRAEKLSFAEWVLKGLVLGIPLTMFTDVVYTPIHVSHLANIILQVLQCTSIKGVYHATGSQVLTKYDFAMTMASLFNLENDHIKPISVDDLNLVADRPKNMALLNQALASSLECTIPGAQSGIELMKYQYDTGWVSRIKNRPMKTGYQFWETL